MSAAVAALEPKSLWKNFADLNAVPRPSKHEERVIQFAVDFGKNLGLPVHVDEVGNVIIKKPASAGMEDRKTVVLQSHLDMVHQKNNDTTFDFMTEGIRMLIDGDWVKAEGPTLGADNGIGVATIMALLESKDIAHPPLEALFTIDEETGMTGALGLKGGLLDAEIMLNLDTEDDDELTIGCAGGVDVTATSKYDTQSLKGDYDSMRITVRGLNGGHSGMDIIKGLGNANKIMNRLLVELEKSACICISKIDGGGLRNAIPRESYAEIAVPGSHITAFSDTLQSFTKKVQAEYASNDADLVIEQEKIDPIHAVMDADFQSKLLKSLAACPDGIFRMSPDIDGLVQTSNNLARVLAENGELTVMCLTRSSTESEKWAQGDQIKACFELIGCEVEYSGNYPGWTPAPSSQIVSLMADLYREMFNDEPNVYACHAGLECGILGTNYPGMEMISFGPNIRGAHSPDEKVQISSVQKYWNYLLETLKRIPVAN